MNRCPSCQGFMEFALIDAMTKLPIYHCRTTAVPVEILDRRGYVVGVTHTLDHSDRFYDDHYRRVVVNGNAKAGYWTSPHVEAA